jgi:hypothetical protein
MPRPRPESDRQHAITLYQSGLSSVIVARQLRADPGWVQGVLKEAGVTRSRSAARRHFFDRGGRSPFLNRTLPIQEIADRYRQGETTVALANAFGVSGRAITRCIREGGGQVRTVAEARLLIDREQSATRRAAARSPHFIGAGEELLRQMLTDRGECPNPQYPCGTKNIDLALLPVAVEIVVSAEAPFKNRYILKRTVYLAQRGWWCLYIWVSRRTGVLVPEIADQVIAFRDFASSNPSSMREHRVLRGCGELAARATDDLDHWTVIPSSNSCPYHSTMNKRFGR